MGKKKLLIMSDSPSSSTGLGRITRELCQRIHSDLGDVFELATLGAGGNVSSRFPWRQYVVTGLKLDGERKQFALPELPAIWSDFAGDESGILFAIWNPSWLGWLVEPEKLPTSPLRGFLEAKPFEKWIYAPIDAEGPNGHLPAGIEDILSKFDRTLFYTQWAARLSQWADAEAIPHGIDRTVFYPRDKAEAKRTLIGRVTDWEPKPLPEDAPLIGITATNTPRKDWAFAFEVCAELQRRGMKFGIWAHTDRFKGAWDLTRLADEFSLRGRVIFSNKFLTDDDLAWCYSACSVTLGIGKSEGFGLPIYESLACGVPCIHCDYGGGAEWLLAQLRVKPVGFYYDDIWGHRRPVMRAEDWADAIGAAEYWKEQCTLPHALDWENCWPLWKEWLTRGM